METVTADLVSVSFSLAENVESFTSAMRTGLETSLRAQLRCHHPRCLLVLRVQSASLAVAADLTLPHLSDAATINATRAAIVAAATQLATSPPSVLSEVLGVNVTTVDPVVDVQMDARVPMAVAPPPPSPPPLPPPLRPPAPPPSPPLPPPSMETAFYVLGAVACLLLMVGFLLVAWGFLHARALSRRHACTEAAFQSTPTPTVEAKAEAERLKRIMAALSRKPSFERLDESQLKSLAEAMTPLEVKAQAVLVTEGEQGQHCYLLKSGELVVKVKGIEKDRIQPGQVS